jgi:5-formyltetrahydrofolate cyclo-ligase
MLGAQEADPSYTDRYPLLGDFTPGTKIARIASWPRPPQQRLNVNRSDDIAQWRQLERIRLIAQRVTMMSAERVQWNKLITAHLIDLFASPPQHVIGGYRPFRGEFDPRFAMDYFQSNGARLALPRVVQREAPLQFFDWCAGTPMIGDLFAHPIPDSASPVTPKTLLIPVVGIDSNGFRLGYGSGYFDRTLAVMKPPPLKIALGYELSRISTIRPQAHDIPMDILVTESGIQRFSHKDSPGDESCEQRQYVSPPRYAQQFK